VKVSAAEPEVLMALTTRSVVALAAFALLACSGQDLTTPQEAPDDLIPSLAKKETVKAPVIQEFWVVRGEDMYDPDIIHVVVSDNVHTVNPSVVYDYFHNGIVDDDPPYDQHFEFYSTGPAGAVVEPLGDGWVHADIEWNGRVHDWKDDALVWPDHLSIEIPDEGDPYAIFLPLLDAKGNTLDWARPRGVVVGGVEVGEVAVNLSDYSTSMVTNHHTGTVRSYATFKGPEATGVVSLSGLSMTGVVCEKESVTTGQGKNRVVEDRYRLTAQLTVAIAGAPSEDNLWWEGHFRSTDTGDTDVLSARMVGMRAVTDATATVVMPAGWDGKGDVEFVVDFLFSSDSSWSFVYDPWANARGLLTTAGFEGPLWTISRTGLTDGMAVPVAHSGSVFVDCG